MAHDDGSPTPPAVTGAVSVGTAPLPFLAVYAALFLLHGAVHPVHPPDITSSQDGELVAGAITAALFALTTLSLVWFLNGRRRWLYAVVQVAVLAGCVDVLIDPTRGGRAVAVLLVLTTVVSLALGFAPDSWTHVEQRSPGWLTGVYARLGLRPTGEPRTAPAPAPLPTSTPPSMAEPATLRRRRFPGRSAGDG